MFRSEWKMYLITVLLAQIFLVIRVAPVVGQLNLGPEELVQANESDIGVPGYSIPSFVHWDDDGVKDLVVGEGSGTSTPGVRVYLNEGIESEPQFSTFFYAQSEGSNLTVSGGG
jgi:hypothetical protein